MNDQAIRQWLRDFGYHRAVGLQGRLVARAQDRLLEQMVIHAQRFLGLKPDGIVGPKTIGLMQRPRCGCPDHVRRGSARAPAFAEACRLSVGVYANWDGIQGITPSHATEVMVANFRQADRFNLRMEMVDDPRDALINIRMGPAKPGVLAWMEVGDGCGWQHQSLFNIDVDWSNELLFAGTNMHEVVGHGAGVGHSSSIGSIMDPTYDPAIPNVIDDWFSKQLRERYGLSGGGVIVPTPDPDPPNPNPEGVPGMDWAAIIAFVLPYILACIEKGADDATVEAALRNPHTRQRKAAERGLRKYLRRTEPGLRRRDRRVRAEALLDSMVARGREATGEEINRVIAKARRAA